MTDIISIKASTPEACQIEILKLLREQATNYNIDARLCRRKKAMELCKAKADGLELAARLIERVRIER